MKITTIFLNIFLLLCNFCQVQGNENGVPNFQMVKDNIKLSAKDFEIMKIYYTTVSTVTIYDQIEESGIVKDIYECSFQCKTSSYS